jgi:hypothetical protein
MMLGFLSFSDPSSTAFHPTFLPSTLFSLAPHDLETTSNQGGRGKLAPHDLETTSNQGGRGTGYFLMFLSALLLLLVSRYYPQPPAWKVIPGHKGEDQPPALKVIPGHKAKELYDAAASYDMMAEVLSLLQEGADPNGYEDPDGNTALIKASMNGDARGSTVELLLKHGANVEAKEAVSKEWEEWTLSWIQTTLGFLLIVTHIPPLSCWFHPRSFFYPFHCSVVALLFLVRA